MICKSYFTVIKNNKIVKCDSVRARIKNRPFLGRVNFLNNVK
jgi:hypothetical protein